MATVARSTGTGTPTATSAPGNEDTVPPSEGAPVTGVTPPAAMPVGGGGNSADIPLLKPSADAGPADAAAATGRLTTDTDEGCQPIGGKGAAGHGGATDPNKSSFM